MPPRVSPSYIDHRRREILDAAYRCFARRGLHGTTMQQIAEEAGLSAGAIYRYYAGKQARIEALAAASAARRAEAVRALESGGGAAALADLVAEMIGGLGSAAAETAVRLDVRLWAEALDHAEIRDLARQAFESLHGPIAEYVRSERKAGRFREGVAAESVGRVVVSLLTGLELQRAHEPGLDLDGYRTAVQVMLSRFGS